VRVSVLRETGAKETRASPLSAAAEHGKISAVRGHWVDQMMDQLENFPVGKDDAVDALANAYNELTGKGYVPLVWGRP
jgi:predicted phage terminase large subunit-like protein